MRVRALILSVFVVVVGCAAPVRTIVQVEDACSREIFIPPPTYITTVATDVEDPPVRPRSISLGYIGDGKLTQSASSGQHEWHEHKLSSSGYPASISFGGYPRGGRR